MTVTLLLPGASTKQIHSAVYTASLLVNLHCLSKQQSAGWRSALHFPLLKTTCYVRSGGEDTRENTLSAVPIRAPVDLCQQLVLGGR